MYKEELFMIKRNVICISARPGFPKWMPMMKLMAMH